MPQSWLVADFDQAAMLMSDSSPQIGMCEGVFGTQNARSSPDSVRGVVTAKTQYNLTNAKEYFEEHLCVGDYYDEGQRVAGEWVGLGAERLGLSGKVRADDFLRLCGNQHPATGETLTQRLKRKT